MSFLFNPGLGKYLNKKTGISELSNLSGIGDKLQHFLFGDKDQFKQLPTQNPEQEAFLKNLFQQLGGGGQLGGNYQAAQGYLSNMISGSPEAYERFASPLKTQFEQQTIPRLVERFGGIGGGLGGGVGSSSGFAQALGGAGAQFQSGLAGLYAQLQQAAANQALGQYGGLGALGLGTPSFQNAYQPGSTGLFGGLGAGVAQGLGQAGGAYGMSQLLPLLGFI